MTLAILAAYIFDERLVPMVQVHLDYIQRTTQGPYRIYGAAPRLAPEHKAMLEARPEVTLITSFDFPPLEGNAWISANRYEHNAFLEALRARAAADGASSFITLHQDSFPIEPGWDRALGQLVDQGSAFATIMPYSYNAGLYWDRAWEEKGAPLLVSEADRQSPLFDEFLNAYPDIDPADGGIGFLFQAWREGREFYSLLPTAPNIWGDCILHLVGATRMVGAGDSPSRLPQPVERLANQLGRVVTRQLPPGAGQKLRQKLRLLVANRDKELGRAGTLNNKIAQIEAMVQDPEAFVQACREDRIDDSLRAAATA
ncbi:MAG: hypothetical protein OIF40_13325 [Mangrovicoccus sp.]|nr:hypothetical protein [Mangrovicoccus sp.]